MKLRIAGRDDLAAMDVVMRLAIEQLQGDFLSPEAVVASQFMLRSSLASSSLTPN